LEKRVMRTWKWMFTAALLASMSAAAQQPAASQPSAPPPASDATQTAQPAQPSAPTPDAAQPSQTQASQSQSAPPVAIPLPEAVAAPTTMDQVVSLFILREHGLIKMLSNRTPVVETYLQN